MKKGIYILLAGFIFSCNNKEGKPFVIEGNIKNTTAKKVYIEEVPFSGANPIIIDSAEVKPDGSFTLKTTGKGEEGLYSLRTEQKIYPFALLISDASKIKVTADMNNLEQQYTVSGSESSSRLAEFDHTIRTKAITIFQLGSKMDSLSKAKLSESITAQQYRQIETASNDLKSYAVDFMNNSKSALLTLYALDSYQSIANNIGIKGLNETEVAEIINKASEKFSDSKLLADAKQKLRPTKVPDITLPDVNGKPVSISSFKGKYLLVDFWASWCQPCRRDNPNVVRAFNQFKDKNFTILGVSLDENKEAWLKAIQDDGLTWTHISDLKYWNSAAATTFKLNSIPYNILLDPEGNIIGEDLHGEELVNKLQAVLK